MDIHYLVFVVPPWRWSGVGLYTMAGGSATPQSKHIAVTTTSMEMICGALGLVVIMPQPANYYRYGV
jgi:hypothetical protein